MPTARPGTGSRTGKFFPADYRGETKTKTGEETSVFSPAFLQKEKKDETETFVFNNDSLPDICRTGVGG